MKITRNDYHAIASAGLKTGELDFVERLISDWILEFPNDIWSDYYIAQIAHLKDSPQKSAKLLSNILLKDPENFEAYELLYQNRELKDQKAVASFIHVISGRTDDIASIFPWAVTLRAVRKGIRKGEFINSETLLRRLLAQEGNNPLVAIEHCRLSSIKDENSIFTQLTGIYEERWPDCIQFKLFKAFASLRNDDEVAAINILHRCLALDPEGLVVERLFGREHDFFSLWEVEQYIDIDFQIPSSIAISLKWNRLASGKNSAKVSNWDQLDQVDPEVNSKSKELKNKNRKSTSNFVYVILTTYNGLFQKFGQKTTDYLISHLEDLSQTLNHRPGWEAVVFLPDDLACMQKFGLNPINKRDAWQIKLSLHDLDAYLKKQSKEIGALLIAGGHEVVPFHNLPNPTDDSDKAVLSDNPYGTISGNFLLQEWPVGRLPDEKGNDAGLLLEQIRQVHQFHASAMIPENEIERFINTIKRKIDIRRFFEELFHSPKDFGYSTAVWRRSSLAAFRPIGKGADLRITPPYDTDTIDIDNLMKAKCAYFNLHGLVNTPDWYGQRDFSEKPNGPDFPVALSAKQIKKIRNNVDLIYSEACYGGFINNKAIEESLALKLISVGSQGLVASTCIAYGSVFTPLIGADLLGFIFWKYIKDGYSFGESLLQAKIGLIKVMSQRQGYLDGEDQKTLLSFVLYGDPLGYLESNIYLEKGRGERNIAEKEIKAITDQDGFIAQSARISKAKTKEIGELVQSYIPSLDNADVKIREHKVKIRKFMDSSKGADSENIFEEPVKKYTQLQYSQKTRVLREVHEQFIRVTLDESEKVVKLAVSR